MKNIFTLLLFIFLVNFSQGQSIVSISPNTGTAGTTLSAVVTCSGTFFQISSPQGVRGIDLKLGGCAFISGSNIVVIDDEHLSVDLVIPTNAANGPTDLEVTDWNPPLLTLPGSFTITGGLNVSVNSISPTAVSENQVVTFTISGQNLSSFYTNNPYQGLLRKGNKTLYSQSWVLINTNTVEATYYIPAYCDSGFYDLFISTYYKGCYHMSNAVNVSTTSPKQLVAITPNTAPAGNTLSALITSTNTFFMTGSPQGINKIEIRDANCNVYQGTNIVVQNDTNVMADFNIPADARNGFYDVFLKTEMYTSYLLPSSLEIVNGLDKNLLTFSPGTATAGTTLNATITGANIDNILNSPPVTVSIRKGGGTRVFATNISATSNTATMDFAIPIYADNGAYDLEVGSNAGCYSISQGLQISGGQPRELVSINPSSGYRGNTLVATITGSNTYFMSGTVQGGIRQVDFVGQMPGNYQFSIDHSDITVLDTNHAELNFTIPVNMHSGWYSVTVQNYNGDRWSLQPGFEILGTVISGNVTFDVDSSGTLNAGDLPLQGKKVILLPDSIISITDAAGGYFFSVDSGQYAIQMYSDTNWFTTTSPIQYNTAVDTTDIGTLDFGLQPITDEYSVYTTLTPGLPRCGNGMYYSITYTNHSTTSVSGQVYLVLDTALQYLSSTPPYDLMSNDTLYWNYNSLPVNNSASISLTVLVPSAAGDTITSYTGVNAISGGIVEADYSNSSTQIVRCSFDPNDKSVEPIGVGSANYVLTNGYLEYLIRFQNTGNDTAYFVMVLDTLSDSFDMSTFSVVAQSHAVETHLYGHVAEFRFNNIMLPDSNVDEAASNGFIKYRIKPYSNTTVGTTVENFAGIYFDMNQPVITNTTSNTLTNQLPIGIPELNINSGLLTIYPNPTNNYFNLILPEKLGKNSLIRIVNSQGQIVKSIKSSLGILTINVEDWTAGIYYILATSDDGQIRLHAKVVKMN